VLRGSEKSRNTAVEQIALRIKKINEGSRIPPLIMFPEGMVSSPEE